MMHKSQFQQIDPYDWFCAPESHLSFVFLYSTMVNYCCLYLCYINTIWFDLWYDLSKVCSSQCGADVWPQAPPVRRSAHCSVQQRCVRPRRASVLRSLNLSAEPRWWSRTAAPGRRRTAGAVLKVCFCHLTHTHIHSKQQLLTHQIAFLISCY